MRADSPSATHASSLRRVEAQMMRARADLDRAGHASRRRARSRSRSRAHRRSRTRTAPPGAISAMCGATKPPITPRRLSVSRSSTVTFPAVALITTTLAHAPLLAATSSGSAGIANRRTTRPLGRSTTSSSFWRSSVTSACDGRGCGATDGVRGDGRSPPRGPGPDRRDVASARRARRGSACACDPRAAAARVASSSPGQRRARGPPGSSGRPLRRAAPPVELREPARAAPLLENCWAIRDTAATRGAPATRTNTHWFAAGQLTSSQRPSGDQLTAAPPRPPAPAAAPG